MNDTKHSPLPTLVAPDAAQKERIEELEAQVERAHFLESKAWDFGDSETKRAFTQEARAEKAEAALQEAVGLIVLMETSLRGSAFSAYAAACYDFLAKQEGK